MGETPADISLDCYNGAVLVSNRAVPMSEVTHILSQIRAGDAKAADQLLPLVYEQLRKAAQIQMADERAGHTLQATALVHEAYLRLVGDRRIPWQTTGHFYAAAAEAMRRILLDYAKAKGRQKRGGQSRRRPLNLSDVADSWNFEETLSLDEAVCRLEMEHPQIHGVVRLRFYAGLSIEDTAAALGISPATVKRRWEFGRTWLFKCLKKGDAEHG
jgi:RNA polymerase sigma factor (TIGR02999 family)